MYRTILVPLDGSERAERVLAHAAELARTQGGRLLLLHVVEPPAAITPAATPVAPAITPWTAYQDAVRRAHEDGRKYLETVEERLREQDVPCTLMLEQGSVVERIVHAAEAHEVDLLAMASHGRTGLGSVFFGSVAVGVLHRVERPILLVRAPDGA